MLRVELGIKKIGIAKKLKKKLPIIRGEKTVFDLKFTLVGPFPTHVCSFFAPEKRKSITIHPSKGRLEINKLVDGEEEVQGWKKAAGWQKVVGWLDHPKGGVNFS